MPPKARPGSLAQALHDAEVYDEFCALMFDQQLTYADLLEQLERWSISSSLGALSRFWDAERSSWTIMRAKKHAEQAYEMAPADLDAAQRRALSERVFALSVSPSVSEKALLKLRDQEIKIAMLQQADRRITLLEAKLNEGKDVLNDEAISDEDRITKMRAIFGR